jgi:molybdopterin converting factor small subunit
VNSVHVRLYANLRERAGTGRLTVEGDSIAAVRKAIATACPVIAKQLRYCRFAVHDEFVDESEAVGPGATVDVIPPVSGG